MAERRSDPLMIDLATARLEQRAASVAVIVALALTATKIVAWKISGSAAVFSDAVEGVVNVVASGVAWWAIRQSHRPADRSHPYGHGRFELLSAALEGGMIAIAAVVILWRAIEAFISGELNTAAIDLAMMLLIGTVVINGAVGMWLLRLGRRFGSPALDADGKHLLADAATTGAAIVALFLVRVTGAAWIDPLAAMVMAFVIGIAGVRVVRRALGDLVDEQDPHDFAQIERLLDGHTGAQGNPPRICSWHKLRVRHVGRQHWVEFHMRLPDATDVRSAHDAASAIEHEIEQHFGFGNATAHVEPCDDEACRCCPPRGDG
ncbi:MAG: cation transporter [Phycisphaeraceae bacterium]|nr:cation transporter [Phycisphaeraceae bacterium]